MVSTEQNVGNNTSRNETSDISFQISNYKIRYVELSRPIAGLFLGGINYELATVTHFTESTLMMISSTISNFIAWILGEKIIHPLCIYFHLYTESKSKNPLYRSFKTLASLGNSIGIIFAHTVTSTKELKIETFIYSASASFIVGLSAFAYRCYQQLLSESPSYKRNSDAQIGVDGWSKYTKIALMVGTSIGQCIGAYRAYIAGCDASTSWSKITLDGAIASVISFVSILILIPVINYITRQLYGASKGILVTKNRDIFNTDYMRSGMVLGASIGSILGGLLAPAIIADLSPAIGIAMGSGVFAIISGLVLSIYGHSITLYLQRNWGVSANTDNSWSYASRSTYYVFSLIGIAIVCILYPEAAVLSQAIALGSAIFGFVGWFVGFLVIWKARQVEPNEQKILATELPWTQRILTGANRGSIIGALVGLFFGLYLDGSLSLMGWILFCGALGGILSAIKECFTNSVARRMLTKILFENSSIPTTDDNLQLELNRATPVSIPIANTSTDHLVEHVSASPTIKCSPLRYSSNQHLLFRSRDSFQNYPNSSEYSLRRAF